MYPYMFRALLFSGNLYGIYTTSPGFSLPEHLPAVVECGKSIKILVSLRCAERLSHPPSFFVKKFKYDYIQKEGNRAILPIFEKILYNRAKN
jgi:hypothetical protein